MSDSYTPRTDTYRPAYRTNRPRTPAPAPPAPPLNYNDAAVNRIPIDPRRPNAAVPVQNQQLWDNHLNSLMNRTIRAYDVVMNYDRDSYGGTRWSREDIDRVRDIGSYLHGDVRELKRWNEVIEKEGEQDVYTMDKLRDDVEKLRKYCEQIQEVIKKTERIPLRQRMTHGDVVQTGQNVNEGHGTNEHGLDGGKTTSLGGGTPDTDFSLPPDLNKLGENAKGGDVDVGMQADLVDPTENPRQAAWAATPSTRFAW